MGTPFEVVTAAQERNEKGVPTPKKDGERPLHAFPLDSTPLPPGKWRFYLSALFKSVWQFEIVDW